MEGYSPILVKHIEGDADKYSRCWECGSQVFRLEETYGQVKLEYAAKELGRPNAHFMQFQLIDVNLVCAVCGHHVEGYYQVPPDQVIRKFDTKEDMEVAEHLASIKKQTNNFKNKKQLKFRESLLSDK